MINFQRLIYTCLLCFMVICTTAQTSTNSPYTRYGVGELSDQHFGNSKAMGGIAYGLRNGMQINAANPASYSAVDSLTFLFDAGFSLQNANFKENGVKTNAKNSTFDYLAMQFRLRKGLGFTLGFLPYSNVGYNMSNSKKLHQDQYGTDIYSISSYNGEGGLQQVFAGIGYNVLENLSIGANFSYLYGDISHMASTAFSNTDANKSIRTDKVTINDYKLDFGAQYTQHLGNKKKIILGAIYSYGHDLNSDGYKYTETYNNSGAIQTQSVDTIKNACGLPHTFGLGATYVYDNRLTIGIDYTLQKWSDVKFPGNTEGNKYGSQKGLFSDRTKISFGAEYLPNPLVRNYLKRIRYRIGAYYSTPYAKIDNKDGNREYGVSFGFGLPIFQSKSILNISAQYVKVSPKVKGMLEENYLRVNIGFTFNERWFMKWKVD